jgi:hypothetical protein
MTRLVAILMILVATTAFAAPAPFSKPRRGQDELARLQGKWIITSYVCCGKHDDFGEGGVVTIKGDAITMVFRRAYVYEYRLCLPGEPGALDMICRGTRCLYRYRLQGDVLSLRTFGSKELRPASLQVTRRDGYYIHQEWRRVR